MIDFILNVDVHLAELARTLGPTLYLVLFLIIFAETGLVVAPFLPGDSLLFAVGAICALPQAGLNVFLMGGLLFVAAVLGDAVNYKIGKSVGPRVFVSETSRFLNRRHLFKTQEFYERHGPFTIVIARFVPMVRTFAPFVAGIGKMEYRRFALYNIAGGFVWVVSFLAGGYLFGNLPAVKRNFHIVIFAIIVVSALPIVIEFLKAYTKNSAEPRRSGRPANPATGKNLPHHSRDSGTI